MAADVGAHLGSATVTIRCLRTLIENRIVTVPRTQALPAIAKANSK